MAGEAVSLGEEREVPIGRALLDRVGTNSPTCAQGRVSNCPHPAKLIPTDRLRSRIRRTWIRSQTLRSYLCLLSFLACFGASPLCSSSLLLFLSSVICHPLQVASFQITGNALAGLVSLVAASKSVLGSVAFRLYTLIILSVHKINLPGHPGLLAFRAFSEADGFLRPTTSMLNVRTSHSRTIVETQRISREPPRTTRLVGVGSRRRLTLAWRLK